MSESIVVTTTLGSKEDAAALAEKLLVKRLIACAQISGPLDSMYWWHGQIAGEQEYKLVMKSMDSVWEKLSSEIERLHPYDIPEIIADRPLKISKTYTEWLREEVKQ